jgi:hypothetical protein
MGRVQSFLMPGLCVGHESLVAGDVDPREGREGRNPPFILQVLYKLCVLVSGVYGS